MGSIHAEASFSEPVPIASVINVNAGADVKSTIDLVASQYDLPSIGYPQDFHGNHVIRAFGFPVLVIEARNLAPSLFKGHGQLFKDLEGPSKSVVSILALRVNYDLILISANFEPGTSKFNGMHGKDRTLSSCDSLEMM